MSADYQIEMRTALSNEGHAMSTYEQEAWTALRKRVAEREKRKQIKPLRKLNELVDATATAIEDLTNDNRVLQEILNGAGKPLAGLQDVVSRTTEATISKQRLIARAAALDPKIESLRDIREADLKVADSLVRRRVLKYEIVLGTEGAASSLLVTGAVVSSTVTGGTSLAIAAGAISADIMANLAAATRIVTKIAMSYGYDAESPDERVYALGVLNYGTAVTTSSKAATLGQLSRLTQMMMRSPTHAQLDRFVAVRVARAFYKMLGFRLTHQKLAQVIPIVGAVTNAGLNVAAVALLHDRAQEAYRLRFLTEKYNLDPSLWLAFLESEVAETDGGESIDLEALIDDEITRDSGDEEGDKPD